MIRRILSLFSSSQTKRLVGEDHFGNKYYEVEKANGTVRRSVECVNTKPDEYEQGMIPTQWEGWIRGSIKDPPTLKDLQDQEAMREIIAQKAAEIKRKDDEAQKKAFEEGLISKSAHSTSTSGQQLKADHASSPFYGEHNKESEPASFGATFEPGAWKPSSSNRLKKDSGKNDNFEPQSWTPNEKKTNK